MWINQTENSFYSIVYVPLQLSKNSNLSFTLINAISRELLRAYTITIKKWSNKEVIVFTTKQCVNTKYRDKVSWNYVRIAIRFHCLLCISVWIHFVEHFLLLTRPKFLERSVEVKRYSMTSQITRIFSRVLNFMLLQQSSW